MRTADNHVYLIDFGIARHFKPGKGKDTIPLCSKGYAAPEQYGKAQTTPQTDIYGLGATLHELLTGDDPSLSLFHFEPVRASKKKGLPITSQFNTLLEQMLEMEMSKRPASMGIVKQELQRLLAQQTAHYQSHAQSSSQAPVKRRRFLIGLASTLVTCSLGSAIATFAVKNQCGTPNYDRRNSDHNLEPGAAGTTSHVPYPPTFVLQWPVESRLQ
jgi:serine/threonine protein kinase